MSLINKSTGMVFINDFKINESFENELKNLRIKNMLNIDLIVKDYYFNKNIAIFSKITKNKPIFYNKGIILEKDIKKLDFLILVGCGGNTFYKISNRIFNNNILKIIKLCKINKIPIIIGVNFKEFNSTYLNLLENVYISKEYYFIPLKITNPITKPDKISFDYTLLSKTISLAEDKIQIKPLLSIF